MNKLLLVVFSITTLASYLNVKGFPIKNPNSFSVKSNVVDHSAWDKLLKKYVAENGVVDYKGFKKDVDLLNNYTHYLATKVPSENWSKSEKLAYFINVYNANTIKLIIDNYPLKSIKDIKNPWSKRRLKIGDEDFSLEDLEHQILRKMNESRIHFAINCASASCPKLLNTAFTAENVEQLLGQAAKEFISNPNKNRISEKNIQLSKIFQWFKSDFTENGSLIDYLNQYSEVKIHPDATIKYLEYDWSLNNQH